MSPQQATFKFLFLFFSFFSSGIAIILNENDIKDLCLESRLNELVTSEVISGLMKRFDGHLSRSVGNFPDESVDKLLIKSLLDDFKRAVITSYDFMDASSRDEEDRSIVAKYKIKQKKYASTDVNNIVAIANGQVTANSPITMRQTHDVIKGSDVNKKIIFIEPEFSLGRSRRAAGLIEKHQDDSIKNGNPDDVLSPDFCQNIRLSEPLDSSSSIKWWAGIHDLRKQLGLID
ncbi:uncharacterized protein LOC141849977 [Brevipalpus obovatus]|uniref:uncharacterized protein LOC141849977 n=1 Tax=Brevipalpus obovatus TaxID=246614 RepID=UPI003D9F7BE1